jgi:hypothetical protein
MRLLIYNDHLEYVINGTYYYYGSILPELIEVDASPVVTILNPMVEL